MIFGTARRFLHHCQKFLPSENEGVLILAYHLIEAGTTSPVDIHLEVFRRQMDELLEAGYVCSLDEAVGKLEQNESGLCKVVITFDDAYENFYTHAWPMIYKLGIPVTLYVPVDFIEGKIASPLSGYPDLQPASWKQLIELVSSGLVTIGSHSCSHTSLTRVSPALARREITDSRKQLEDRLEVAVETFCYPKALWSRSLDHLVRKSYRTAVIGGGWKMRSDRWDRYRLNRVPVRSDMPAGLAPLLSGPVWLEEWMASHLRRWVQ